LFSPTENSVPGSRLKFVFPVCTHPDCPKFREPEFQQLSRSAKEAGKPFHSQSEYTKHMRDEHNECLYPCDVAGCERIGRKGYFREKDLIKHRREQHPDAAPYNLLKRELKYRCTEPGCGAVLEPSSIKWHHDMHDDWNRRNRRNGIEASETVTESQPALKLAGSLPVANIRVPE